MKKVYIAIDNKCSADIIACIREMGFGIKIGHPMIGHVLNGWMSEYIDGIDTFLDLKFFDITSVVIKGIDFYQSALKPSIITVHALGGRSYMTEIVKNSQNENCYIAAVTVLTSVPTSQHTISLVQQLAEDAHYSGIKYAVCSYNEIAFLHNLGLKAIVPGIRSDNRKIKNDDQLRTISPELALLKSDICVVGRHVTEADDPILEMQKIFNIIN